MCFKKDKAADWAQVVVGLIAIVIGGIFAFQQNKINKDLFKLSDLSFKLTYDAVLTFRYIDEENYNDGNNEEDKLGFTNFGNTQLLVFGLKLENWQAPIWFAEPRIIPNNGKENLFIDKKISDKFAREFSSNPESVIEFYYRPTPLKNHCYIGHTRISSFKDEGGISGIKTEDSAGALNSVETEKENCPS